MKIQLIGGYSGGVYADVRSQLGEAVSAIKLKCNFYVNAIVYCERSI